MVARTAPTAPGLARDPEYLGLLGSKAVSLLGDQLARVALTVLVYERTGSTLLSALTFLASFLPVALGGPLLGGLADRTPPRRLLVGLDLVRGSLFALMAVPELPLALLLALLVVATTVGAPWAAGRQSLLREILGEGRYQRGSGLDETLEQSGQIVGFAVGGLLVAVVDPQVALLLDAASFLGAALLLRLTLASRPAPSAAPAEPGRGRLGRDARVGWHAAMAPACRWPLLLTWAGLGFAAAPEAVAVPWADHLGGGSRAVGLLYAAVPAGTVLGLLVVARLGAATSERLVVPLALATLAPLAACVADPPLPVVLGLLVASGVGSSFSLLARSAFVRGLRPLDRGRAFAVAAAGVTAGQGVGLAAGGGVAAALGPPAAVGLLAAVGLVVTAWIAARRRALARTG